YGWVTHAQFADTVGWSLTERGRVEDGKRLAEELAATSAREIVELAYQAFQPLNQRLVRACTDWQLRPQGGDPLAANDHTDPIWEARVLDELSAVDSELGGLIDQLANPLPRFGDYHHRFSTALARARAGELHWVAGVGVPSCHSVWMQLHEDLLSTLGVSRAEELG
ncbi:MAG: transcriptional regulator, partial [Nakamurella sp.]